MPPPSPPIENACIPPDLTHRSVATPAVPLPARRGRVADIRFRLQLGWLLVAGIAWTFGPDAAARSALLGGPPCPPPAIRTSIIGLPLAQASAWWTTDRATATALALSFILAAGVTWSVALRRRLIAQRRRLEQEMSRRLDLERHHRELTEGAPDAIYTLDAFGRFLSANPAAVAFTGRSEAELKSLTVLDIVAPDERDRVRDRLRQRFESDGSAASFDVELLSANGQRRTMEVTSRVIRPPDGRPYLEGVARDVTERRRAQDAIQALLATTAVSGDEFLCSVVRNLAEALRVHVAFIGIVDLASGRQPRLRTMAVWQDGSRAEDFEIPLTEPIGTTACTSNGSPPFSLIPEGARDQCPDEPLFRRFRAEAFVGVCLRDAADQPLGMLGCIHREPFQPGAAQIDLLRIFAARTGAEIDRVRAAASLQASEERFRQLAEQTRDIVWVTDLPSGQLTYLSPSFTRITGVPVEKLGGNPRRLLRLVHREDLPHLLRALRASLDTPGARFAAEFRVRRSDGTLVWILDEGVVIRNARGAPYRLSGVARDITTRKAAELALAAERARFRDLFENSPDSIFVEALDGTILDVNRAACQLHACPRDQLVGRRVADLVPPRYLGEFLDGFARLVAGENSRLEGWSLRSDGAEIPVELQVNRLRHEGREALLVHVRDIRARREAEEFLAGQKRILEWIARARPVEAILAELLRVTTGSVHGLPCCIHWLPSESELRPRAVWSPLEPESARRLESLGRPDQPVGQLLARGATTAPEPEGTDPSNHRPGTDTLRIELAEPLAGRTVLVQPMRGPTGQPLGALTALLPRGAEPTPEALELQRLTASLAGVAIQRHRGDATLRESSDRLRTANAALLSLARSEAIAQGDLREALREITGAARHGIGVDRATVWLFEEDGAILRCTHADGDARDGNEAFSIIQTARFPSYVEAITRERFVSASHVRDDPRTSELFESYLAPRGITSLLDAGIRLGGRLIGVLCHEHRGEPRLWKNEEELFASSLADLVAQALQASQRRCMEEALRQSEEAYRSVVGVLAEGVMLINRDGAFVTFNDSAAQILGRTHEFLQTHRIGDVDWQATRGDGTPLDLEEFPVSVTRRTGKPVSDFVLGVERPDGSRVWLSINTRPFTRDERGEIESVVVSFADITSRQAAERELRRGHDLLRAISQTQARFIADADPARNLRHMLTALVQMTGSESGIIGEVNRSGDGRPGFLLCAALDESQDVAHGVEPAAARHAPITEVMEDVLRSQHHVVRSFPDVATRGDGAETASRHLHLLALPLRLDGEIVGVAGLARTTESYDPDIQRRMDPLLLTCANLFGAIRTARQRQEAEARIRQLNAELEQRVEERTSDLRAMNEELAEFAYVVTHDLKAPLRGIHQLAEWLTHDHAAGLDEGGLKLLALLRQRVSHLQRLVDGLLACARVGRAPELETTVPVSQLVQEVVEVLAPPPNIVIEVPPDLPVVHGNPERLHQVFQNLLDNAVKYANKTEGRIRVQARRRAGAWEFQVADNGPGIPERYQEKVFQIFQRLDPRGDIPGTGLGLTLVRRIIESRGGRAWIESVEGEGTTVCFTWPDRARRRPD